MTRPAVDELLREALSLVPVPSRRVDTPVWQARQYDQRIAWRERVTAVLDGPVAETPDPRERPEEHAAVVALAWAFAQRSEWGPHDSNEKRRMRPMALAFLRDLLRYPRRAKAVRDALWTEADIPVPTMEWWEAPEANLVLVRKDSGGVFPDGTTNHPALDFGDVEGLPCDWGQRPDEDGECPYCAGEMCARFDGLGCTHNRAQRHGYPVAMPVATEVSR